MDFLRKKFEASPVLARVLPFVIFVLLTSGQGRLGEASSYWIYLVKTILGAGMVWLSWPVVKEMRWAFSWEAVVVGVAVFAMWVGLDGHYPSLDQLTQKYLCPLLKGVGLESLCPKPSKAGIPWNPHVQFGQASGLAWLFILTRILGSTFVVPPIEEVFYRSFLYRYIVKPEFQVVGMGVFHAVAFLLTSVIFGFTHYQWLAGILCGFAYQGLVIYKKRLGDAMTAHSITNLLLGIWVVYKSAWQFW